MRIPYHLNTKAPVLRAKWQVIDNRTFTYAKKSNIIINHRQTDSGRRTERQTNRKSDG